MSLDLHIRTIEAAQDMDANTMYDLIYLTNHLPQQSELNGGTHDEIRSSLEAFVGDESNRAVLMIAEQLPLRRAVGYVATHIDANGQDVAEITHLAVVSGAEQAREVGNILIQEAEAWGEQHDARVIIPRTIEFAGKLVGKEVVEVITDSNSMTKHPSYYLG